ncbi:MAG TPA: YibE/F family protein [Pseudobacteroides sp.]
MLNKKLFCSEVFQILCGGIGIVLIIPVTVLITSRLLYLNFLKTDK